MPSIPTYDKIQTYTAGASQATFTFTSIPQTYTELVIVVQEPNVASGSNEHGMTVNGDTGNNYQWAGWYVSGTSRTWFDSGNSGVERIRIGGGVASEPTHIRIFNYSQTGYYKGVQVEYRITSSGIANMGFLTGVWRNTNAITSVTIDTYGGQFGYYFRAGTVATMYGIKAG